MRFFNTKSNKRKVLIHIFAVSLFVFGIIFGCFYYFYGTKEMIEIFGKLFFVSKDSYTNDYSFYIFITGLYILLALFVSTSFIGLFFNSFIVFTKGIHICVSTMYLFGVIEISAAEIFTCYLPQLLIEMVLVYIISIITLKLSINSFMVAFISKENFNSRKIINYILDYLIVIMIILTVSMLFRVYLI